MSAIEKYMDFSVEEYAARVSKAQALMKEQGIDSLFITQAENIYYFSGYMTWLILISKHRPTALILPAEGEPVLILPKMEVPAAQLTSWMTDLRGWLPTYIPLWVEAFKEKGLLNGVIGAELGEEANLGMPILDWDTLKTEMPGAKWVDAQSLLYQLRMIKSPQEIAYMREASRLATVGVAAGWDAMRAARQKGKSITEVDVANEMNAAMSAGGAQRNNFLAIRSGAIGANLHNKFALDRELQEGDWVAVDYGCTYKNYQSDTIRAASFGPPKPSFAKYHEIQMELIATIEKAIKPGKTVRDICEVKIDFLKTRGLQEAWPGMGHALGMNVHELPRINPVNDITLVPGFCFTCEPGFVAEGETFCIEDNIAITEDGFEVLTTYPHELFIA